MDLVTKVPQQLSVDYIGLLEVANELDANITLTGSQTSMGAYAALMAIARAADSADTFFELYSEELSKLKANNW